MSGFNRPNVLVVARETGNSGRIAAMLEEAGIIVATVRDGAAASVAVARERYDLAIVATSLSEALGDVDLVKRIRSWQPGIELLFVTEAGAPAAQMASSGERRRPVAPVPGRLFCAQHRHLGSGDEAEAEFGIAAAELASLHQRRFRARGGARRETAAGPGFATLWRTAGLAAAHRALAGRGMARR